MAVFTDAVAIPAQLGARLRIVHTEPWRSAMGTLRADGWRPEAWVTSRARSHPPGGVYPPTPHVRDAPHCERCVQSNRRPQESADEPKPGASVCENRAGSAVIQQHHRDQPAHGAAGSSSRASQQLPPNESNAAPATRPTIRRGRCIQRRSEQ